MRTYPFAELARAAKVDNLDGTAFRVTEEDVFRLEVAVDDAQLRRAKKEERHAQLLRELAREVEGDAAEASIAQEVVKIVRE